MSESLLGVVRSLVVSIEQQQEHQEQRQKHQEHEEHQEHQEHQEQQEASGTLTTDPAAQRVA